RRVAAARGNLSADSAVSRDARAEAAAVPHVSAAAECRSPVAADGDGPLRRGRGRRHEALGASPAVLGAYALIRAQSGQRVEGLDLRGRGADAVRSKRLPAGAVAVDRASAFVS